MSGVIAPEINRITAERSTSTGPRRATRERLLSLDVFRGMTIAAMLLVNNPGSWAAIYPPLEHAPWHGWTPTDLIFPFFLFIVGVTTHLSISARRERGVTDDVIVRQVLTRAALIFLLGFLMSLFPFYQWGAPATWPVPLDATGAGAWERLVYRWQHVRILGVLQRIGLAYAAGALLTLRAPLVRQVAALAALLFGYWIVMTTIPVPGHGMIGALVLDHPPLLLSAWLDRTVLGVNHLWSGSVTWDPEGLLSTVPAAGSVMLGVFAGRWLATRGPLPERLSALFAVGAIGMALGSMWGWVFPINKGIWSSSYVLFTGGLACVALATCMWVIDVHKVTRWTRPFVIYGVNPIVAFVGSGVMARCIYTLWKVRYDGATVSVQSAIYRSLFASWLSPVNASLLFAVTFVLLWLGILTVLYRRNIVLKV